MPRQGKAAGVGPAAQGGAGGGGSPVFAFHNSTSGPARQAPSGVLAARLDGGVVYIGPRNVAAVRGGALQRVFSAQTELLRGCALSFRLDVLRLAQDAGAARIVATERASGDRYVIGMAAFMRLAWAYDHPAYGQQLALELRRWERPAEAGQPVQLALFEAVDYGR